MTENKITNRPGFKEICRHIPQSAKVLDLGCGDGSLLEMLRDTKGAEVFGIEIDQVNINSCIAKGIPVIQANLNDGLGDYGQHSFDYVILSETLQMIKNPEFLLSEMLRVGKVGVINFINIGYWYDRFQLLWSGRMPKNKQLPHEWYNTPNIHLGTIKDFRALCDEQGVKITKEFPTFHILPKLGNIYPNLLAKKCVFLVEK